MKKLSRKILSVFLVIVMLVSTGALTVSISAAGENIKIGDYMTLGTYYGEPIVWRCVDIDENGPLMLSDKILCLKSFDANGSSSYHNDGWGTVRKAYGSNCWSDSSIRQWLNASGTVQYTHCSPTDQRVLGGLNAYADENGFLTNFSDSEKAMIKTVTQKNYLNAWDAESRSSYRSGGTTKLIYSLSLVEMDYSGYYYQNVTDSVFLLNPEQADAVAMNLGKDYLLNAYPTQAAIDNSEYKHTNLATGKSWAYWFAIPRNEGASYENLTTSSYIGGTANDTGLTAYDCRNGVRPAFYLNTDNVEAGEKYPVGYDVSSDKYGFLNPERVIESKKYTEVYGLIKGQQLYSFNEKNGSHGLCYGMASTTGALLENRQAITSFSLSSPDLDLGNVENIASIFEDAYSTLFKMTTIDLLQYGHIYQYASDRENTINNLRGLYNATELYVRGKGPAVVITVWLGDEVNRTHGHSILATGIKETKDYYVILIDDSNFWQQTELFIGKDFSEWSYSVDDVTFADGSQYSYGSSNGVITYDTPGSIVYNIGLLAGGKTKSATTYLNDNRLLVTSEASLTENDKISEIFVSEINSMSTEANRFYWVDADIHDVELSATEDDSEVTVSDVYSSVSVVLDSGETASFSVDDTKANRVNLSAKNNVDSAIEFSSVAKNGEIVAITITGTVNGDEITATETDNGIQVTGLNNITVTYETPDGTSETKADVKDGSTVNITVNDDENKVETDWQNKDESAEKSCSCNCHSNSFMQFLHKIVSFLRKLFGMTQYQYCGCGKAHW